MSEQQQAQATEEMIDGVNPDVAGYFEGLDEGKPAQAEEAKEEAAADEAKPAEDKDRHFQRIQEMRQMQQQREPQGGGDDLWNKFEADPIGTLQEMAKRIAGDDVEAQKAFLREELYTPLMIDVLGADEADNLDPGLRARAETARLKRKLEAETKARQKFEEERKQERLQMEQDSRIALVKGRLAKFTEAHSERFPFLAVQDSPEEVLFDLLHEDENLTPEKAAELANEYFETRDASKYRPLLLGDQGNAKRQSTSATTESIRPSLTNSGATAAVMAADGTPNLDDPDTSAEYWAEMLEKNPAKVLELYRQKRR